MVKHAGWLLASLALASLAAVIVALTSGSVPIGLARLPALFTGELDGTTGAVILDIRLPRVLAALATGGLLATAGVLMQVLLRNPLADPYLLGISGGAAVAALAVMALGLAAWMVPAAALVGALTSMALVFGLARGHGSWTPTRLLLTGVVIASGWAAMISFLLAISPNSHIHGMLYWLLGDLGQARGAGAALVVLALAMIVLLPTGRHLNVMTHGDLQAAALGVDVKRLRLGLYVTASILTAVAVTVAGTIGFIGLVVPHLLRLAGTTDHRVLIPASALLGGLLLVLADTLARTVLPPTELPVGIFTALLGIPLFLVLLYRRA